MPSIIRYSSRVSPGGGNLVKNRSTGKEPDERFAEPAKKALAEENPIMWELLTEGTWRPIKWSNDEQRARLKKTSGKEAVP